MTIDARVRRRADDDICNRHGQKVLGLRDERVRSVRPDAVIDADDHDGTPHTLFIEYDRTRRLDKNFEKFRRYDTFLCWWWGADRFRAQA